MKVKYLAGIVVLVGIALIFTGSVKAADMAKSTKAPNPIKDTIDQTPSIKEMQSQPARDLAYTMDILGNKIPTQTDNSGQR